MHWELKKQICDKFGSQLLAAIAWGVDPTVLSQVIRGRRPPTPAIAKGFKKVFGQDIDAVLNAQPNQQREAS